MASSRTYEVRLIVIGNNRSAQRLLLLIKEYVDTVEDVLNQSDDNEQDDFRNMKTRICSDGCGAYISHNWKI